jgi:hypothetical protein
VKKGGFSWRKRATKGSSFFGLEKQLFEGGLVAESWKELLIATFLAMTIRI